MYCFKTVKYHFNVVLNNWKFPEALCSEYCSRTCIFLRHFNWFLKQNNLDHHFDDEIMFSDEVYFHLDEHVNTHNSQNWGLKTLMRVIKKKMQTISNYDVTCFTLTKCTSFYFLLIPVCCRLNELKLCPLFSFCLSSISCQSAFLGFSHL